MNKRRKEEIKAIYYGERGQPDAIEGIEMFFVTVQLFRSSCDIRQAESSILICFCPMLIWLHIITKAKNNRWYHIISLALASEFFSRTHTHSHTHLGYFIRNSKYFLWLKNSQIHTHTLMDILDREINDQSFSKSNCCRIIYPIEYILYRPLPRLFLCGILCKYLYLRII